MLNIFCLFRRAKQRTDNNHDYENKAMMKRMKQQMPHKDNTRANATNKGQSAL